MGLDEKGVGLDEKGAGLHTCIVADETYCPFYLLTSWPSDPDSRQCIIRHSALLRSKRGIAANTYHNIGQSTTASVLP